MALFAMTSCVISANRYWKLISFFTTKTIAPVTLRLFSLSWNRRNFLSQLTLAGILSLFVLTLTRALTIEGRGSFVGNYTEVNCKDYLNRVIVTKKNVWFRRPDVLELVCYTGILVPLSLAYPKYEINLFTGRYV